MTDVFYTYLPSQTFPLWHGGNEFGRDGDSWPMKMHHSFGLRFCFAVCKTTCLADTPWELAVACKTRTLIFSPMTHKRTSEIVDSIDYILTPQKNDHHPSSNRTCFYFASSTLSLNKTTTQPTEQVNILIVLDTDWQRWFIQPFLKILRWWPQWKRKSAIAAGLWMKMLQLLREYGPATIRWKPFQFCCLPFLGESQHFRIATGSPPLYL